MKLSNFLFLIDLLIAIYFGLAGQMILLNCKDFYTTLSVAVITIAYIIFFTEFGVRGIIGRELKKKGKNPDKIEV